MQQNFRMQVTCLEAALGLPRRTSIPGVHFPSSTRNLPIILAIKFEFNRFPANSRKIPVPSLGELSMVYATKAKRVCKVTCCETLSGFCCISIPGVRFNPGPPVILAIEFEFNKLVFNKISTS